MKRQYQSYTISTANKDLPVTLEQARQWLRLDEISTQDDEVQAMIMASVSKIEKQYGMALLEQTVTETRNGFPSNSQCPLLLRINPLREITSITYIDTDGVKQTWDSALYETGKAGMDYYVLPAWNESWPSAACRPGSVTIVYKAGFGTAPKDVPLDIVQAIKLDIGDMDANRADRVDQLPKASEALLRHYYRFSA